MFMFAKRWNVEVMFESEWDVHPPIKEVHGFCTGWGARRFCNRAVAAGQDAKVMPPLDWFYAVMAKWESAEAAAKLVETVRILRQTGVTDAREQQANVTQVQRVRQNVQEDVAQSGDNDAIKRSIIPIHRGTDPKCLDERIAAAPKAVARVRAEMCTAIDEAA